VAFGTITWSHLLRIDRCFIVANWGQLNVDVLLTRATAISVTGQSASAQKMPARPSGPGLSSPGAKVGGPQVVVACWMKYCRWPTWPPSGSAGWGWFSPLASQ